MKNKRKPVIQFKKNKESWKEIKAGSIFYSLSDKNHPNLPVLSASQEKGMVFRDQIGIDIQYNVESTKNYKRVVPGQFVIHLRSFQGGFAFSAIEGITSPAYTVLDFKNKEEQDVLFWKHVFSSKTFIKKLESVTYGIRDGRSISFSDFSTLKFIVPNYEAQKQIGSFFKDLDDLISRHQQELDALKQTKQGFLQKMFPQEGELVPKIRFSEYKSEWKSIKLSNLTTLFTDGDWIESKDQSEEGIRLIQTGNIGISKFLNKPGKEKWITEETFKKLKCQEIYAGDILISRLPEPAGRACILPSLDTRTITAVDCTIIRVDDNSSSEFLLQYLSTNQYFNVVKSYLGGGTRQRISRSVLGDLIVRVPKELTEQVKIGEFFKQLDEVIDLKEQELDALKQTKQGFLQKMFV